MKHKTLTKAFLLCLLLALKINAQAQYWNTPGGNATTSGDYIGANSGSTFPFELKTLVAQPINFYTSNTPRMTLSSGGSLSIGLTVPSRRLDVLDAGNPQLRLTQTAGADFTDFQTTSAGNLLIAPSNGNVGIGTVTTPITMLHLGDNITLGGGSRAWMNVVGTYTSITNGLADCLRTPSLI